MNTHSGQPEAPGNDEVPDSDNELRVTDNLVGGNRSVNVHIYGRVVATGNVIGSSTGNVIGSSTANVIGSATESSNGSTSTSNGLDLNSVDTGLVADNTISGNFYNGFALGSATGVRVVRNKIGTNSAGTSAIGDGAFTDNYGIYLCGGSGNQIGAPAATAT